MSRYFFIFFFVTLGAFDASAEDLRYTGAAFRDPFAAQASEKVADTSSEAEKKIERMTLQGVLLSSKNPRAIINGKIYHIGSLLESGKVSRIDKDGVTVIVNGKEIAIEQKIRKAHYEPPASKK